MRLVLLGPPGAGKGTQAAILSDALSIPHVSTGDLFRDNISRETELGREAQQYMDAGRLVPTSVTANMVRTRLGQDDAAKGFLLDGFPRTIEQAEILRDMLAEKGESLDAVVNYTVSEDVVVERMLARGRKDDNEEVIRTRLQVYRDETAPLIDFYRELDLLVDVDAEGTVEDISSATLDALDK
ncbi:adenylate kinase [Corynebacterium bovis]|uniref:Adenylate kinase n=2 Tax=Corynebacterium bovis TaxID=36808 RepID=A0A3R8QDR1_9CORY|nr:adenylate kinase [Corynebacterium bovis]MBB3116713.1 adenylate kinase [Corynebacterium bovis DSM 20582 = CIP 54.80]MDN8580251.1 adenylate kinase [Corynebacterium bovis]QQC47261.1 adenylate kinase [Corynebacterium bovis]RRO81177.1 adenylate kinase [Corynebacterium bovis]RRO81490.1 adenylate kinase [Corynebacterium bovis]